MRSVSLAITALASMLVLGACTPSTGSTPSAGSPSAGTPSIGPATTSGAAATTAQDATALEVRDFTLEPLTVSVAGSTVVLAVTNAGPTVHNVKVRDATGTVLFGTRDLREGESETVSGTVQPGTYVLFCSLPGHESLGIKGTLTVAAP